MRAAVASMALVTLTTLALYVLVLYLIAALPGVAIEQPTPIAWVGAFSLATVFAGWNLWDSLLDARAAYRHSASARTIAGSLWRLRSDVLQGAGCTAWAGAGALAIMQWGTPDIRAACIFAGAIAIVANQVWNRIDRERVSRMPGPVSEARVMERLAVRIAADAREMGHEIAGALALPVGVLELLKRRQGMTPEELADIENATAALLDLAEHVAELHARVKLVDPGQRRGGKP